ncbi:MAG: hypothetical protein ACXVLQ_11780 [Bacteriovorax sp.]
MFKQLAIFCLFLAVALATNAAEAKIKKKKSSGSKTSRTYRPSKHARKSRHYRHHGTGPDLKAITTESPYKEEPSNGVTPIETKQPGL